MRPIGIQGRTLAGGLALVAALALTLTFVVASLRGVRAASDRATGSAEVIAVANRLERQTIDLETGVRGFLLFGQPGFLEPLQSAEVTIPGQARLLQRMVSSDPGLEAQAHGIATAIHQYEVSWSAPLVRLALRDPAAAKRRVAAGEGKARMDAIRHRFALLIADQERRAAGDDASASTTYTRALTAAIAGTLAVLLLVALYTLYQARVVVAPVRSVAEAMRKIRGGDLSARVEEAGVGETRELSAGFNEMAESLAHARAGIAARNAELEAVLGSTADAMTMVDREGAIVFSNRAMERFRESISVGPDRATDERLAFLGELTTDPQAFERYVEDIEADAARERSIDVDLSDGRGFEIWSGPVRDLHREIVGRLFVLRDVTSARDLDRLKENFIATVSHELRTPLTSMQGFVELLLEDPDSMTETARQYLTIVERNTHRLSELVGDILLVAQLEAGHAIDLTIDDVDPAALVAEAAEDIAMLAASKGITVSVEADELPAIRADRSRLTQLLANLTTNAVKFTGEHGYVTLRAREDQDELLLEVIDTGHGISRAERDRLFEPFFRSQDETKRRISGTGLGLPTALAIAQAHGGTITVHDNPGGGTIFRLHLPVDLAGAGAGGDLVAAGPA